jgi:hypothetical protein
LSNVAQHWNETKPGDRVGAILRSDAEGKKIYIYGYGVYEGDFFVSGLLCPNPRIKLDNGKTVWGYQCWWLNEHAAKYMVSRYQEVIIVSIEP